MADQDTAHGMPSPLRPLVDAWLNRIIMSKRSKQAWNDIAEDCMQFFSAGHGFMWGAEYRAKFNQGEYGAAVPRFPITVAKAFELVAIFGPTMYTRNPVRTCTPQEKPMWNPAAFGDQNDPQVQQKLQQMGFDEGQRQIANETRAELMYHYLNYTPNELPGGGLKQQAENTITEALVKGRGLLWTEVWTPPGSQSPIVGSFYDTVDNLFLDPDAELVEDCQWIVRRITEPRWKVERRYKLPKDTLRSIGEKFKQDDIDDTQAGQRSSGDATQDYNTSNITYYKIWSKMGIGARHQGMNDDLADTLDEALGDHVYLVVAEGVPYPLNMPPWVLMEEADEIIKEQFKWPIPFYTDDRWPFVQLDFYNKPRSAWPIAPMAPGLGELKFINMMTSHLANRIWTSSRDFIAIAKSAAEDIKATIEEGRDQSFLEVSDAEGGIDNVVKFLQQPQTNMDAWKILDYVFQLFDKRTGLSEILYGVQNSQSRSATDANTKKQSVSIRPDFMSEKCEEFLTEASRHEAFAARWLLEAKDVIPIMGQAGAFLWEKYITSQPIEETVREISYRVEHGTARRPDRERDANNINMALQSFGPIAMQLWGEGGDPAMMNFLIQQWGKTNGFDTTKLQIKPPPPPPEEQGPPPGAQEEQARVQAIQQKMQADQQMSQARVAAEQASTEQIGEMARARSGGEKVKQRSALMEALNKRKESTSRVEAIDRESLAGVSMKRQESKARIRAVGRNGR